MRVVIVMLIALASISCGKASDESNVVSAREVREQPEAEAATPKPAYRKQEELMSYGVIYDALMENFSEETLKSIVEWNFPTDDGIGFQLLYRKAYLGGIGIGPDGALLDISGGGWGEDAYLETLPSSSVEIAPGGVEFFLDVKIILPLEERKKHDWWGTPPIWALWPNGFKIRGVIPKEYVARCVANHVAVLSGERKVSWYTNAYPFEIAKVEVY